MQLILVPSNIFRKHYWVDWSSSWWCCLYCDVTTKRAGQSATTIFLPLNTNDGPSYLPLKLLSMGALVCVRSRTSSVCQCTEHGSALPPLSFFGSQWLLLLSLSFVHIIGWKLGCMQKIQETFCMWNHFNLAAEDCVCSQFLRAVHMGWRHRQPVR